MVPSRPDRCAPRRAASPRRLQTGIRSAKCSDPGSCSCVGPDKLDAAEQSRLDVAVRRPPAAQSSMGRARRAAPASISPTDRKGALAGARPVRRHLRHRRHPRVHRASSTRSSPGMPADPRLAPNGTAQQRPHRPHQQPAPGPATPSPRLHQLRQLRSPRPPPNMNPAEPSSPNPNKRRRLRCIGCRRHPWQQGVSARRDRLSG